MKLKNCIQENTIGKVWIELVKSLLKNGKKEEDEKRKRIALQNVIIESNTQNLPDKIINRYGNKTNVDYVIRLTFKENEMYDADVVKSFSPGSKSYYKRIKDGKMIDFVVERLAEIPESKKAVMVFPTYDDYKAVLKNPKDDYLPCIVAIQFRLREYKNCYKMNTIFFARSIDAFQKAAGNLVAITMLSHKVAKRLNQENLKKKVVCNSLSGFITDAHIYQETLKDAKRIIKEYDKHN